ncbi:hypothetical protein M758_UG319400 [Ceratodon purpureus]|nr:hypothetical protein M758_UG319400 [Ceratodon purpureus]
MKRNLNIQSLLMSVLSSLSGKDADEGARTEGATNTTPAGTTGHVAGTNSDVERESSGSGSSEGWWDRLCMTSEEEVKKFDDNGNQVLRTLESKLQIHYKQHGKETSKLQSKVGSKVRTPLRKILGNTLPDKVSNMRFRLDRTLYIICSGRKMYHILQDHSF